MLVAVDHPECDPQDTGVADVPALSPIPAVGANVGGDVFPFGRHPTCPQVFRLHHMGVGVDDSRPGRTAGCVLNHHDLASGWGIDPVPAPALRPPSTTKSLPVQNEASSDARKLANAAIS